MVQALEVQRRDALAALEAATAAAVAVRRPLQRRGAASAALSRAPAVKMYNPRFEEDFATGRDYDPDRRVAAPACSKKTFAALLRIAERTRSIFLRKGFASGIAGLTCQVAWCQSVYALNLFHTGARQS